MTGRASPGSVLAGATAAQAAVALGTFGLPAVGPEVREELGLTLFELGAILAATLLGSGLALIAVGSLVDRVGSRTAVVAGTVLGSLGLVVAGLADAKEVVFLALLASGVGSAVVPIAGTGALFRSYPPMRRGRAMGVRQMAVPLGGTIGAITFPPLVDAGGLRLALLVSALAVAVVGAWFTLVLPTDRPARPAVQQPFRTILRSPGVLLLLGVAACYIVVLQALITFIVPAVRAAGHSELTAGVAYLAVNLTAMVGRVAWGAVADRHGGRRRARTLVEVGVLAAVGALLFDGALRAGPIVVVLATVLFALGALGWNALVYLSAGEQVDSALTARSVALAATVVFVLSGVSTPLLGALVDAAGWDALWFVCALVGLAGAGLAARFRGRFALSAPEG
jgi:MFS family permease